MPQKINSIFFFLAFLFGGGLLLFVCFGVHVCVRETEKERREKREMFDVFVLTFYCLSVYFMFV